MIAPTPYASSSIEPHEVRVGSPRPRKLSVVSERIATATVSVVFANTIGTTFGSRCLPIRCRCPAPRARERST